VVVGNEVAAGEAELPFAGLLIRTSVRAKHGRAVSDQHSTLRRRVRRIDEHEPGNCENNDREADGCAHVVDLSSDSYPKTDVGV